MLDLHTKFNNKLYVTLGVCVIISSNAKSNVLFCNAIHVLTGAEVPKFPVFTDITVETFWFRLYHDAQNKA